MPVHGIDNGNNKHEVYTTEELLSILQQAIASGSLQGIDPTQTPIVAAVRESHNNSDVTFWSGTEAEFNELTGVTSELVGARIGSDGKLYILSGDTTLSDTVEAARQAALEATEGMKREVISVTLMAEGWSNTAPYTQTVAVAGMTADKDFLAPYLEPTGNESEDISAQVALSCISGGTTDTDSVTFYCYEEKPQTTITVHMVDKGTKLEPSYPIASATNIGMVKVGEGLNVDQAGELTVEAISFVTPEMFGAKGDGITDDTTAIQNAFNSGANVSLNGTYLLTNSVNVKSNQVIYGNHSKIISATSANIVRGDEVKNVSIYDLEINGNNTASSAQIGIAFRDSEEIAIKNVNVSATGGDGVYFSECKNCKLSNAVIKDALISAFAYNSEYIDFDKVEVYKPRFQYGIQFKSCSHSSMNDIYVDTPKDCGVYISIGNEEDANDSSDIALSNITVLNQGQDGVLTTSVRAGIVLANGNDYKLLNGTVLDGVDSGIWISSSYTTVLNSYIEGCNVGIDNTGSNNTFKNCNIITNTDFGIRIRSCNRITLDGIYAKNNSSSTSRGNIILDATEYVTLTNSILEITGNSDTYINVNVLTSISNARICNNVFINPGNTASYADYRGIYDFSSSVFKNNGSCRFFQLKGLSMRCTAEWDNGGLVISDYRTAIPTYSGFSDGDKFLNKSGVGYIGWVYANEAWHPYGAIE